jgi:hypothetical protein
MKSVNAKARKDPTNFTFHVRKQPRTDTEHYIDNPDQYKAWLSALLPKSGIVNDFRDKMYQNELRAVQNRANVMEGQGRRMMERGSAEYHAIARARPLYPGIQLFYQNTVDQSPLPGRSIRGGAVMTQVERNPAVNKRTNAKLDDLLRSRVDQISDLRQKRQEVPIPSLITVGDDAKYQLAVAMQTIGNNIQRDVYDKDMLRGLQSLCLTLARNIVLLDHDSLMEFYKFIGDHRRMMAQNAKNIAREQAAQVEDDEAHYANYYPGVEIRAYQSLKDNIYEKLGQIMEYLRLNAEAASRPANERIAVARTGLRTLDISLDQNKYTKEALALLQQNAAEEKHKEEIARAQRVLGGVVLPPDVVVDGAMPVGMRVGDPVYERVILAIGEAFHDLEEADFEVLEDEGYYDVPQQAANVGNDEDHPAFVVAPVGAYAQEMHPGDAQAGEPPAAEHHEVGVQAAMGDQERIISQDQLEDLADALAKDTQGVSPETYSKNMDVPKGGHFRLAINTVAREFGMRKLINTPRGGGNQKYGWFLKRMTDVGWRSFDGRPLVISIAAAGISRGIKDNAEAEGNAEFLAGRPQNVIEHVNAEDEGNSAAAHRYSFPLRN